MAYHLDEAESMVSPARASEGSDQHSYASGRKKNTQILKENAVCVVHFMDCFCFSAIIVPIVVNNFSLYYTHAKTRIKLPKDVIQDMRRNKSVKQRSSSSPQKVRPS